MFQDAKKKREEERQKQLRWLEGHRDALQQGDSDDSNGGPGGPGGPGGGGRRPPGRFPDRLVGIFLISLLRKMYKSKTLHLKLTSS